MSLLQFFKENPMPSIEQIKKFLNSRLPSVLQGVSLNQYAAKPLFLEATEANEKVFNDIYLYLRKTDMNTLQRTKAGSIRKGPRYRCNDYAYDIRKSSLGVQLTISLCGRLYVVKYGNFKGSKSPEIYPNVAFDTFVSKCSEYGINMGDYVVLNGDEIKKEIEHPLIAMYQKSEEPTEPLKDVHHIDFHNSYPAGLANTHPEFRPVVEYFYEKRKENPVNKAVLNYTIGWMQSWEPEKGRRALWASLSRDAIADNNARVLELTIRLMSEGRTIIGHNTDGIWYQGEVYHGTGEGSKLGEWENDHTNCTFRARSDGAYEFIENGQYHAVIRGTTALDAIEPDRTKWTWGSLYNNPTKAFKFDIERGIYHEEI